MHTRLCPQVTWTAASPSGTSKTYSRPPASSPSRSSWASTAWRSARLNSTPADLARAPSSSGRYTDIRIRILISSYAHIAKKRTAFPPDAPGRPGTSTAAPNPDNLRPARMAANTRAAPPRRARGRSRPPRRVANRARPRLCATAEPPASRAARVAPAGASSSHFPDVRGGAAIARREPRVWRSQASGSIAVADATCRHRHQRHGPRELAVLLRRGGFVDTADGLEGAVTANQPDVALTILERKAIIWVLDAYSRGSARCWFRSSRPRARRARLSAGGARAQTPEQGRVANSRPWRDGGQRRPHLRSSAATRLETNGSSTSWGAARPRAFGARPTWEYVRRRL